MLHPARRTARTVENPLVGLWFHSIDRKGHLAWQGQVLERVGHRSYRVQLYEWWIGAESDVVVVSKQRLIRWQFYATNTAMREAFVRYKPIQDAEIAKEVASWDARRTRTTTKISKESPVH